MTTAAQADGTRLDPATPPRALADAGERMRTLLQAMGEGYALTVAGEIVEVNDALCRMLGLPAAELLGLRPPYPFWIGAQADGLARVRADVDAAEGGTFRATFRRSDGETFPAEVRARALRDPDGRRLGFVNTLRDLSDDPARSHGLERSARTDRLTGLANRRALTRTLCREGSRTDPDALLALILLDLDGGPATRRVADPGRAWGDGVTVELAGRLTRATRAGELLARDVDDGRFAWLLSVTSAEAALAAAARARATVACRPFRTAGPLTASAGVGVLAPPFTPDALYALADGGLRVARREGPNRTGRAVEAL